MQLKYLTLLQGRCRWNEILSFALPSSSDCKSFCLQEWILQPFNSSASYINESFSMIWQSFMCKKKLKHEKLKSHLVRSSFARLNFVLPCFYLRRRLCGFMSWFEKEKLLSCSDNYRDDSQSGKDCEKEKSKSVKRDATLTRTITLCREALWRSVRFPWWFVSRLMKWMTVAFSRFFIARSQLLMNHCAKQHRQRHEDKFLFYRFLIAREVFPLSKRQTLVIKLSKALMMPDREL